MAQRRGKQPARRALEEELYSQGHAYVLVRPHNASYLVYGRSDKPRVMRISMPMPETESGSGFEPERKRVVCNATAAEPCVRLQSVNDLRRWLLEESYWEEELRAVRRRGVLLGFADEEEPQDRYSHVRSRDQPLMLITRVLTGGEVEKKEYAEAVELLEREGDDPLFFRVSGDRRVSYGDGGISFLNYPIIACDRLPISEETRSTLVGTLRKLGEERADVHADAPVLDIIDPDLAPYRLDKPSSWSEAKMAIAARWAILVNDGRTCLGNCRLPQRIREATERRHGDSSADDDSAGSIRYSYAWVPTNIALDWDACEARVASPIHNLPPVPANQPLYSCIEKVLSAMMPQLERLGIGREVGKMQAVVKAQCYQLEPHSSYSGMWHVDGASEPLLAVGVYYCDVDAESEGGALKFRPTHCPDPSYEVPLDVEVPVRSGTSVVFAASLPHRFRAIYNRTDRQVERLFLNFFFLDPGIPSPAEPAFFSAAQLDRLLAALAQEKLNIPRMPAEITRKIRSYLPRLWESGDEAREFRGLARSAMLARRSGFGYTHYGNCGVVEYANDECERTCDVTLRATDSDGGHPSEVPPQIPAHRQIAD